MADTLASPADLAAFLNDATIPEPTATLLLETATGVVQGITLQRIVQATSTVQVMGVTDSWLDLPERPVTAVSGVELDGAVVTVGTDPDEYKRVGSRLWRGNGWAMYVDTPSVVEVVYTHGYAAGAQDLQYARQIVLMLAAQGYSNPTGVTGFSIDDYREQYAQSVSAGAVPDDVRRELRRRYGRRGGLVRLG